MKRLAGILIAVALVSAGLAQGTFTIRRPLDGSTVRENVKIRIPRSGISDRQYIGVTVNGRFIEAAIPEQEGDDWVYTLDTKAMDVPDGACTIELVLYQDNGDQGSVVVDRTSVDVTVDNFTSIGADPEGVRLRYRFPVGSELIYFTQLNAEIETLSAAAAANNQRGNKRVLPGERVRFAYSIMNSYAGQAGREGLMSIQPRRTGPRYGVLDDYGRDAGAGLPGGGVGSVVHADYGYGPRSVQRHSGQVRGGRRFFLL